MSTHKANDPQSAKKQVAKKGLDELKADIANLQVQLPKDAVAYQRYMRS